MKRRVHPSWLALLAIGVLLAGFPARSAEPTRLQVYGVLRTLEISPILLAAKRHYPAGADMHMGGIPSLYPEDPQPSFHEPGKADVASHAETQILRNSVRHPDLRVILTVSEGLYRVVARRSSGIANIKDLKGKRIVYAPATSAAFYLHKILRTAGLTESDVTLVPYTPAAAAQAQTDAVVYWEPESQAAFEAFGKDAVEIYIPGIYRERYNLNTTAANLADPAMRRRIVDFVGAIVEASCDIRMDPSEAWQLASDAGGHPVHEVARSWGRQVCPAYLPTDLLDVMTEEEQWLAGIEKRSPRSRAQLAPLIDATVLRDVLASRAASARRC